MRIALAFLVFGAVGCAATASRPPALPAPQAAPPWVSSYWEQLVGTWVADNSAFKDANDTMDAYGIEWSWGLGRRSLIGRLYGIQNGKDIGTFWQFREFWHPGEGRLVATQFAGNGTYGTGPHERKADGSMEMVQTFFDPAAGTTTRVGHRATLAGDVHTTTSYDVDAQGTWKERRTYIWRRQR